jgi:hypothetical protein
MLVADHALLVCLTRLFRLPDRSAGSTNLSVGSLDRSAGSPDRGMQRTSERCEFSACQASSTERRIHGWWPPVAPSRSAFAEPFASSVSRAALVQGV